LPIWSLPPVNYRRLNRSICYWFGFTKTLIRPNSLKNIANWLNLQI